MITVMISTRAFINVYTVYVCSVSITCIAEENLHSIANLNSEPRMVSSQSHIIIHIKTNIIIG